MPHTRLNRFRNRPTPIGNARRNPPVQTRNPRQPLPSTVDQSKRRTLPAKPESRIRIPGFNPGAPPRKSQSIKKGPIGMRPAVQVAPGLSALQRAHGLRSTGKQRIGLTPDPKVDSFTGRTLRKKKSPVPLFGINPPPTPKRKSNLKTFIR